MVPSAATQAHSYPNLKSVSLLSIGKLCDTICSALFTKKDVTIFNSDKNHILDETRKTYGGLWDVTIKTSQPEPLPTATINRHKNSVLRLEKKNQN